MCIELLQTSSNAQLRKMHADSAYYYERAKEVNDTLSAQFWADDLTDIEKELANRGLMLETDNE